MDRSSVTAVLSFLVNNKLDPLQCLKPLVDAGFTHPDKIYAMTSDQVKSVLPKSTHRRMLEVLRKRQHSGDSQESPSKRRKGASSAEVDHAEKLELEDVIAAGWKDDYVVINRAPVMILWSVALGEARGFDWDTALSLAAMVAERFAKLKGRGLGLYPKHEEVDREVEPFPIGWEPVVVSFLGKPFEAGRKDGVVRGITGSRDLIKPSAVLRRLRRAFKDELEKVYALMRRLAMALVESYREAADNAIGYEVYCGFRPSIPKGRAGWGAKGRLELRNLEIPKGDVRFRESALKTEKTLVESTVTAESIQVALRKSSGQTLDALKECLSTKGDIGGLKDVLEQMQLDGVVYEKQGKYYLL